MGELVDQIVQNVIGNGDENYMRSMNAILSDMLKIEEYLDYILLDCNCMGLCHTQIQRCKNNDFVKMNDAFETLELILTRDCARGCAFLTRKNDDELDNYDQFFGAYNEMLFANDAIYATKRRGFKLLCDILESKEYKSIMMKYISDKANLKRVLVVLGDKKEANTVTFEAFHVFKLFLGNPRKVPDVYRVLHRNKTRLETMLETFQKEH